MVKEAAARDAIEKKTVGDMPARGKDGADVGGGVFLWI